MKVFLTLQQKIDTLHEAYCVAGAIRSTAHKYNIDPVQIRQWKIRKISSLNLESEDPTQSIISRSSITGLKTSGSSMRCTVLHGVTLNSAKLTPLDIFQGKSNGRIARNFAGMPVSMKTFVKKRHGLIKEFSSIE